MFFTYSYYSNGLYYDCYLTHDIGPYKAGHNLAYIYRPKERSTTFVLDPRWDLPYRMSIAKFIRVHSAARKIQRAWRRCVSDPSYQVCQKRLLNEFEGTVVDGGGRKIEDVSMEFDFSAEVPEIIDKHVQTMKRRVNIEKDRMRHAYLFSDIEIEPELPSPQGKRKFFCA